LYRMHVMLYRICDVVTCIGLPNAGPHYGLGTLGTVPMAYEKI
jgi:hypothetical protein